VCERCGALRLQNPDDGLVGGDSGRLDPHNGASPEPSNGGSKVGASARLDNRATSGWYYVGHGQLRQVDADGWTEKYRNSDEPVRSTPVEESVSSSPLLAHADPGGRPSRRARWFVAATVAAVTAVAVSASGTAEAVLAEPTVRSPAPRVAIVTAKQAISPFRAAPSMSPLAFNADFSKQRALAKAADIIGDMENVDECLRTGVDVNSALVLLSRSFGRLAETGIPPTVNRSDYLAQVTTLQSLTAEAAEGYGVDRTAAMATYSSVRNKTGVLFRQINRALGSSLSVP